MRNSLFLQTYQVGRTSTNIPIPSRLHFCNLPGVPLYCQCCYVPHLDRVPHCGSIFPDESRGSYGAHVLDHLAADGAGFAGGQVTVVTVGQVHANLPWCLFYIVNFQISIVSSEESVRTGKVGTAAWSERLPMNL